MPPASTGPWPPSLPTSLLPDVVTNCLPDDRRHRGSAFPCNFFQNVEVHALVVHAQADGILDDAPSPPLGRQLLACCHDDRLPGVEHIVNDYNYRSLRESPRLQRLPGSPEPPPARPASAAGDPAEEPPRRRAAR